MGHVIVLGKHTFTLTVRFPYWKGTLGKWWFSILGISSGCLIDDMLLQSKIMGQLSLVGMLTRQPSTSQCKIKLRVRKEGLVMSWKTTKVDEGKE